MTQPRHHLRALAVAFVAIVGLLSMAGNADASSTGGANPRGCCVKRTCAACCCEPANPVLPAARQATGSFGSSVNATALPCECRSSDSPAPASRHESRSVEERSERGVDEFVEPTFPLASMKTLSHGIPSNASPPHSLACLRTTHLLI